jgi:hypothetical protein
MQRSGLQQYYGEVRAYFAAVNRSSETGTVFDPSAGFSLENPPAPWVSLGLVRNFKRTAKVAMGALRAGAQGVTQTQFRTTVDARVSLDFCEWGKLQMALAASSQHMNVLESAGATAKASGGTAKAGQPVLTGSTASLILVDPAALVNYSVGELLVVDVDYVAGATLLGTGITGGAASSSSASAQMDSDAVRRVSFNVGCVSAVTSTGLQLDAPLLGGVPASGAKAQKVVAFLDREGASFLQEWSAVFVVREASGGQAFFYYPRLQAAAPAEETIDKLAPGVNSLCLHAEFAALAAVDANDGESVVCYRSLIPAANVPAY